MSGPLVEVRGLARAFGAVRAVDGISFGLMRGQVAGLIGANGAGKTTAMRILATLDLPDAGTVRIGGTDIADHPNRVRRRIGWMPDHFTPYDNMTVGDYLDFFGRAQGYGGAELARRVAEVRDFTDLAPLDGRPVRGLSKGQAQRLCLARTLLSDPEFLILDEPAAGLDPKARLEFKNLVRVLRERGKTLLISSHILSELGEMCDTLIFMDAGRLVHHGDTDSLQRPGAAAGVVLEIETHGPVEELLGWLAMRPGWRLVGQLRGGARAEFADAAPPAVAAELRRMAADLQVTGFKRHERRLEEAFVEMLRNGAARPAPPPLPPQPQRDENGGNVESAGNVGNGGNARNAGNIGNGGET